MTRKPGFTLLELTVVVIVIGVLIVLLIPLYAHRPHPAYAAQNASQVRGIMQSMAVFAEFNGGKYPGLTSKPLEDSNNDGFKEVTMTYPFGAAVTVEGSHVEPRFWEMLSRNSFTGESVTSPFEIRDVWTTGPVTSANYSYAMPEIATAGERRNEWRPRINVGAPILSDRNIGTAAAPQSNQTNKPGKWQGQVGFNDVHVETWTTYTGPTQYGAVKNPNDHLFAAAGPDDAYLIHSGK